MKYYNCHCQICNTDFDLLENDFGYMGTCDCIDVPTDPELEDTVFKPNKLSKEEIEKAMYEVRCIECNNWFDIRKRKGECFCSDECGNKRKLKWVKEDQ